MYPDHTPATELAQGVTLLTKDGRKIGNAIITSKEACTPELEKPDTPKLKPVWTIQTDFGSEIKLNKDEIEEKFYLGFAIDLKEWVGRHIGRVLKSNGYYYIAKTENRLIAEEEFGKIAKENKAETLIRQQLAQAKRDKKKVVYQPKKAKSSDKRRLPVSTGKNADIFNTVFSKKVA